MKHFGRVVLVSFLLSTFAISSAVVLARGVVGGDSSPSVNAIITDRCGGCAIKNIQPLRIAAFVTDACPSCSNRKA
jgi:hypothetical protein